MTMKKKALRLVFAAVICLLIPACSTMNAVSDTFISDSDPQLVGDALPFTIKMCEALLEMSPKNIGLLETTGSLFVMYAKAFIQGPAEQMPRNMFGEKQAAMERSKELYLRGLKYLYRSLDLKYKGFDGAFQNGKLPKILAKMKKKDVPSLYWAAAGGLSAYSLNPFDLGLGMRIQEFYALILRAYELDPNYNSGALDDFLLIFYASVPESMYISIPEEMGKNMVKAEAHYQKALEKSKGLLAGPYVSYATSISVPAQDYDKFKEMLDAALAIDPDGDPSNRLVNIISQRKAQYLLDSAAQLFINFVTEDDWEYEY